MTISLAAFILTSQSAFSQDQQDKLDKESKDKERELRMQEAIKAQKKALYEQKKAQEEAQKEMEKASKDMEESMKNYNFQLDSMKNFNFNFDSLKNMGRYFRNFNRDMIIPDINVPPMYFNGREHQAFWGQWNSDDGEHSSWDFSKSLKENSFSGDYTFDVEQSANSVVMSVNGDCKAGDIRIKIVSPNGKTYSDIVIDEFGNLNWRKSFNISGDENQDKTGAWKFHITASKATGYFKISLQTW